MKRQTKKMLMIFGLLSLSTILLTSCYHDDDPEIFETVDQIETATDENAENTNKPG